MVTGNVAALLDVVNANNKALAAPLKKYTGLSRCTAHKKNAKLTNKMKQPKYSLVLFLLTLCLTILATLLLGLRIIHH